MPTPPTPPPAEPGYSQELYELLERGTRGLADATEVRAAFDRHPELVSAFGDLAGHAERESLALICRQDHTAREAVRRRAEDLRASLKAECATELERLLADRVVLTWLAVHEAELDLAGRR